jgi:hypothetical protein
MPNILSTPPWRIYALEPALTPVGHDVSWAEPTQRADFAGTYHAFQSYRLRAEFYHAAEVRDVVDEASNPLLDAERATAIGCHFPIEKHAAIAATGPEGCKDLFLAAYLNPFTGLQVKPVVYRSRGCALHEYFARQPKLAQWFFDRRARRDAHAVRETHIAVGVLANVRLRIPLADGFRRVV